MYTTYLGIGTNLGDKTQNINSCISYLEKEVGEVTAVSSVYETEPWGVTAQNTYYNLVAEVKTTLFPFELLKAVQAIENRMGRVRKEKWGSRIIDIDILFYGNYHFSTESLIIPHPQITKRNFVLSPLSEIAPELTHPIKRKKIALLKEETEDKGWIKHLDKNG